MPQNGTYVSDHVGRVRSVVSTSAREGLSAFAASWRRSLVHHKLDPSSRGPAMRMALAEIRARRDAAGELVRVAGPALDRLSRAVGEAGCAVMLSDAAGIVLDERVRDADRGAFDRMNLVSGADWSEGAEGTNGIGTCLAEARPVTVWRDQHFRAPHGALKCSGAPVFGAEGSMVGVIDISSVREDTPDAWAQLLALSVQDAAQRIEAELFRLRFQGARILSANEDSTQGVALLALDRDDLVIGATRSARRRFGLGEGHFAPCPATDLIGAEGGSLDEAQRAVLAQALARSGGNVAAAARALGIGRATFYRKARALGLAF
ncbi:GAF domain-containing protein [Paenirhodobacter enshiensis]|uniref:Transcriptional regulator n=1 Tax=Paenirhodobacter enshiensis TaxID=1105367 RepID=A0A086XQX4_9RHOB|nr:GAF domain-containing protein [Paenirhodobacter enshiensis]KFI24424.1 transcriptional regulator [Paenirhodobacter enshiensis]